MLVIKWICLAPCNDFNWICVAWQLYVRCTSSSSHTQREKEKWLHKCLCHGYHMIIALSLAPSVSTLSSAASTFTFKFSYISQASFSFFFGSARHLSVLLRLLVKLQGHNCCHYNNSKCRHATHECAGRRPKSIRNLTQNAEP